MAWSASAPPRCWRRCASGTSGASGSPTWCRCSATGPGRLALAVLVLERTGSPAWAAGVTAVSLAGFVGIGQVLATLADRHGRVAVMLVADVARAALFAAMLLPLPVGGLLVLAFLAGLATPPFEAARSAALPDLVPEDRYGEALALAGHLGAVVAGHRLRARRPAAHGGRRRRSALAINADELPRVGGAAARAPPHRRGRAGRACPPRVGQSLGDGAASLFRDRLVRRALVIVAVTGALGTVGEALVVPVRRRGRPARGSARAAGGRHPGRHPARHRRDRHRHPRPPSPAPQRRLVRGGHRRPRPRRCSGWRRAAPSPSSPSRSPAGCSPCRSPPTP